MAHKSVLTVEITAMSAADWLAATPTTDNIDQLWKAWTKYYSFYCLMALLTPWSCDGNMAIIFKI